MKPAKINRYKVNKMADSDSIINKIKEEIKACDKLLIGIGNEWNHAQASDEYTDAYAILKNMISDKDYYIISLATDDGIYSVWDESEHVVTPCGGYRYLQCDRHIVPVFEAIKDKSGYICPECGRSMVYNNIYADKYLEEGYIPAFNEYKTWLQSTINKKLCILELGCDDKYPTVIKNAFDRIYFYNQKAVMFVIGNTPVKTTENETDGKYIINSDSVDFIRGLK